MSSLNRASFFLSKEMSLKVVAIERKTFFPEFANSFMLLLSKIVTTADNASKMASFPLKWLYKPLRCPLLK